ncbi:MAG: hypothetical protein ACREMP_01620 [Candidatus Tyrphobacter sp.]
MDSIEAREHLEMADRILGVSTRELRLGYAGRFFVIWGLFAAWMDVSAELTLHGILQPAVTPWIDLAILIAACVLSAVCGRAGKSHERGPTVLQREFLRAMGTTFGVCFVAMWAWRLFPGFSVAGLWSVACAVILFFVALHGNRRALVCGIVVIVSMFVASGVRGIEYYVLAAGLIVGYAGFGILETLV